MATSATAVGGRPERESDVLDRTVRILQDRLPPGWSARAIRSSTRMNGPDAVIEVVDPGGRTRKLAIEAQLEVTPRSLPHVREQAMTRARREEGDAVPLLALRYASPNMRTELERQGMAYIDTTGNVHVVLDEPGLFLRDRGADSDPWRGRGRPLGSLKGGPAALITRALVDFRPPMTLPALARRAGTSVGASYRVVELLAKEALLTQVPRKGVTDVAWRRLIERWSQDYGFQSSNPVRLFLSPRGLRPVAEGLANISDLQYAVTGSLAAEPYAPYAPPRLAMVYAAEPEVLATRLDLTPVDANGNVLIARSNYSAAFQRLTETDGVRFVAPSQAAVDLLTAPGRGPSEGEALLDWMEANEAEWRK